MLMLIVDLALLGIDAVVLAIVYSKYRRNEGHLKAISNARPMTDRDIHRLMHQAKINAGDTSVEYAVITGRVKPVVRPIRSFFETDVAGVVSRTTVIEETWRRFSLPFFWRRDKHTVNSTPRKVPYALKLDDSHVKVFVKATDRIEDALLELIHTEYKYKHDQRSTVKFGDQVTRFRTEERMLKKGTWLTGIGTLSAVLKEDGVHLVLHQPAFPADGSSMPPYMLTTRHLTDIVAELRQQTIKHRHQMRWMLRLGACVLFHLVAMMYLRRWRREKRRLAHEQAQEDRRVRRAMIAERLRRLEEEVEQFRQAERTRLGQSVDPECVNDDAVDQADLCVICWASSREVLILECGHLCCCLNCGQILNPALCPVCREPITRLVPAFIS